MVNRPKAIGTAAETAVKNFLLSLGFSPLEAHRNVLKGRNDEGDVWLRHPVLGLIVFEVKGGKSAKEASFEQCVKWVRDAEHEARNANAAGGVLVAQRAGVGYPRAGQWWVYLDLDFYHGLGLRLSLPNRIVIRMTLADFMRTLDAPQA